MKELYSYEEVVNHVYVHYWRQERYKPAFNEEPS